MNNCCKGEFSSNSLNSFFILLYYSYETHLQILERLCPAVVEICFIWEDMRGTIAARVSFHPFFLIHFLFCSIIAMKRIYKFSKSCTQQLWRYVYLGGYEVSHNYRSEFLTVFFNSSFILLYYSYETRLQIFERLRPAVM